jgi:tRNA-specific 2-thiouridylase
MSGGVDSSVTAALLQQAGHQVIGITMKLWNGPTTPVDDALRVAGHLAIEHHVASFEACFKSEIMDYFVHEYAQGKTPNPCARCNHLIKFGALMEMAHKLGADYLATGHYARIVTGDDGRAHLHEAINRKKDQTYFLFSLTEELLQKIIFPLGTVADKEAVRAIAARFGLPIAEKDESQDICFIPDNDYISFLENNGLEPAPGDFVLSDGRIVGKHEGIHRYTIGQRRGMGIAWSEPLYVLDINPSDNRITVGTEAELYHDNLTIRQCNWIQPQPQSFEAHCRLRYRHRPVPCKVTLLPDNRAEISFTNPEKGVTPGQVAAFYRGDELLGGGWIE